MKITLRILVALYLMYSCGRWPGFIPDSHDAVRGPQVFCGIVAIGTMVAAIAMLVWPRVGRILTVVAEIPQALGAIPPVLTYHLSLGTGVFVGLRYSVQSHSILPLFHMSDGVNYGMFIGSEPNIQYYGIGVNLAAVSVVLVALYAGKKAPNKPSLPTPASETPAAVAPVALSADPADL